MHIVRTLVAIALLTTLVAPGVGGLPGQTRGRAEVVENARAATVALRVTGPAGTTSATGFIATHDGVIVTADHVVAHATAVDVQLATGEIFPARGMLHSDADVDLAVLKVEASDLPTVSLGNSDDLEIGHRVLLVRHPSSSDTVLDGMISSARLVRGRKLFRVSVPPLPDNAGAPVITESGRVVGMVIARVDGARADSLSLTLPSGYIREIIRLVQRRKPERFMPRTPAYLRVAQNTNAPVPSGVPAVVNQELGLDYTVLDGVETTREEFRSGEHDKYTSVRYSITTDVAGMPVLERELSEFTRVPKPEATFAKIDYTRLDERALMRLDGSKTELFRQTAALHEYAAKLAGSFDIAIVDTLATLTSPSLRRPVTKGVPRGVIPHALLPTAIAALPDSLPEQVFLWTVAIDTVGARVLPVRFRFGKPTTKKVPISKGGRRCADEKTKDTKMRVTPVQETTGAVTRRYYVLSDRPHLRFEELETACIALPRR